MEEGADGFQEIEIFLRSFFGLCFYCCSLSDVMKHPHSYPILTDASQALNLKGIGIDSKVSRMNDLLRSFEGYVSHLPEHRKSDHSDDGDFWTPIYGIDRELEKLFHDVGG
jgi:hypothetical protein